LFQVKKVDKNVREAKKPVEIAKIAIVELNETYESDDSSHTEEINERDVISDGESEAADPVDEIIIKCNNIFDEIDSVGTTGFITIENLW
jgi:hypothetical protein